MPFSLRRCSKLTNSRRRRKRARRNSGLSRPLVSRSLQPTFPATFVLVRPGQTVLFGQLSGKRDVAAMAQIQLFAESAETVGRVRFLNLHLNLAVQQMGSVQLISAGNGAGDHLIQTQCIASAQLLLRSAADNDLRRAGVGLEIADEWQAADFAGQLRAGAREGIGDLFGMTGAPKPGPAKTHWMRASWRPYPPSVIMPLVQRGPGYSIEPRHLEHELPLTCVQAAQVGGRGQSVARSAGQARCVCVVGPGHGHVDNFST